LQFEEIGFVLKQQVLDKEYKFAEAIKFGKKILSFWVTKF